MILNCENSWGTHSNHISLPHHHTISYHNNREAWALVHKIRNQDFGSSLRALKERWGQNLPGKNLLPNFFTKIKVAQFVFTNHWLSIKINLFLKPGVPFKERNQGMWLKCGFIQNMGNYADTKRRFSKWSKSSDLNASYTSQITPTKSSRRRINHFFIAPQALDGVISGVFVGFAYSRHQLSIVVVAFENEAKLLNVPFIVG